MRFNPKANIGGGRVRDVRGGGGGGRSGGGLGGLGGIPMGGITGGGIGTTVVVIVIYVIVQLASGGSSGLTGGTGSAGGTQTETDRYASCQTGADANQNADCARRAVEVSLESFWNATLPQQAGIQLQPTQIVTFAGSTSTGCGAASEDVGPFYCPTDRTIYLDTDFFKDIFEGQLGGQGGDFVEPYVIAHEFGHHIQNLLGTMSKVKTQQGPTSDSVRLELQADCYAGMWAKGATQTTDDQGQQIFESITQADIQQAIGAAKTVGDDYIEKRGGQQVNPESWTHGSSAERMKWFTTGYDQGTLQACDTFSATSLS